METDWERQRLLSPATSTVSFCQNVLDINMLLRCNKTSPRAATLNANFIRGSMQERHLSMQMTELRISKLRLVPAKCVIAEVGFCAVTSIQMWKPFSSWIQQRRRRRTLAFVVVWDSWNSHCSTIWRYECCESKLDRNKNTEFISHKRTAKCDPLLLKYPTVSTPTGNKDLHFIYLSFLNTQPSCLSVMWKPEFLICAIYRGLNMASGVETYIQLSWQWNIY